MKANGMETIKVVERNKLIYLLAFRVKGLSLQRLVLTGCTFLFEIKKKVEPRCRSAEEIANEAEKWRLLSIRSKNEAQSAARALCL